MRYETGNTRLALTAVWIMLFTVTPGSEAAQTRQQPKVQPPAQTPGESNATPSILVSTEEDYRIGPRDVIEIRVEDAPELSITATINADGTFLMTYLKRVRAEGKTTEELAREIADRLRGRYLKDPSVVVAVKQFNSRSVFVLGQVRSPGVYQIEQRAPLLKLITLAGGPADNFGSTAFIFHEVRKTSAPHVGHIDKQTPGASGDDEREFEVRTVNISGMFKGIGLVDQKSYVEPGDIVNIPKADTFFVAGEVNAPGPFPLSEGTTLRQAIALSQGTTMNAALSKAVIFRQDPATGKSQEIPVDIAAVMKGKQDVPIMPNDMVIVPKSGVKTVGNSILKALGMGAAQRGLYR